jgi:flagellar biosynthetic protein FliP
MITRRLALIVAGAGACAAILLGAGPAAASPALSQPALSQPALSQPALSQPAAHAVTASVAAAPLLPAAPTPPKPPAGPGKAATGTDGSVNITVGGANGKPSDSIVIMIALTVLSVAPALLLLCTSFTKIFVVLSITRNALGLTSVPPNQVLAGLALFLSLFIMGPVLSQMNHDGVQPYLHAQKTQSQAFHDGVAPLRTFMTKHTRKDDLALLTKVAEQPKPASPDDVPLSTLVPAFILSELRAAFIIGFVVYIPFLVIDMVVSASLMSMGMMMLPPVTVSLPFKLLLFVLVNGWGLIITALVASYH